MPVFFTKNIPIFFFPPASFFPDCCQNYICRKLKWLFLEVSKYQNLCDSFIRHFLAISTLTYWMVAKRVGKPFDCFFCYYLDDLKKSQFLCKYQPRVGCFDFWPLCFWPCINRYVCFPIFILQLIGRLLIHFWSLRIRVCQNRSPSDVRNRSKHHLSVMFTIYSTRVINRCSQIVSCILIWSPG